MSKTLAVLALVLFPTLANAEAVAASGKLSYKSGPDKLTGVLVRPVVGPKKHPGLILIHEWWGLNDFARGKAEEWAKRGFVTLAVDLYRGKVATDPDTAHQLSRGLPPDRALRDLRASIDALSKESDVDPSRIAVIGWCMGGGYAAELTAADPRVSAVVIYYGALPTDEKKLAAWKAPVLGNFGAEDKGIPPEAVRAFEAALKKKGVTTEIKIYPGAGHAFASSNKPEVYRPEAAKDADARAASFLQKRLVRLGGVDAAVPASL